MCLPSPVLFQAQVDRDEQRPGAAGTNTVVLRDVLSSISVYKDPSISAVTRHLQQTNQLGVFVGLGDVGPAIRQVQL